MSEPIKGSVFNTSFTVFFRAFVNPALSMHDVVVDSNGRMWTVKDCVAKTTQRHPGVLPGAPSPSVTIWNVHLKFLDELHRNDIDLVNFDTIRKVEPNSDH